MRTLALVDPQRALPQIRYRREHRRPQRHQIIGLAVGKPREVRRKHSTGQFAISVTGDQRQQFPGKLCDELLPKLFKTPNMTIVEPC